MTRWLDDEQQRAWRTWLDLNALVSTHMNRQLQASSGLSLSDYDVLVALTDVDDSTLRMYELGERLQWHKSRVSKQVSRMAARGLVERNECPDDRRGAFVHLTAEGRAAIEAAAPDHVEFVQQLIFDGLTREQLRNFSDVTVTLLDRVRSNGDVPE